ncbi:hypothetical protein [Halpernia sp.]|uniref:hypothetical protein n=1 Tax=Halpernia sp. TaxID=2782209 RepID=UPI003A8CAE89
MKNLLLLLSFTICSLASAKNNTIMPDLLESAAVTTPKFDYLEKLNLEKSSAFDFEKISKYLKLNENYKDVLVNKVYKSRLTDNYFVLLNNNRVLRISTEHEKFYILIDLNVNSLFDMQGNGGVLLHDNLNNINDSFTFKNGVIQKKLGGPGEPSLRDFCQRTTSETFNECFNRESAEFCDSFISTAAYVTHPEIAVLIAAGCSCYEVKPVKKTITAA